MVIEFVVVVFICLSYLLYSKTSGMRVMAPIPYDWDRKNPIITTNNVDVSALFEQVSGGFIFPAI
jgi:hypothetical protein